MNANKDFKHFYEKHLVPDLEILDMERKEVDRQVILIVAVTFILIILEGILIPQSAGQWKFIVQPATAIIGFILISITTKQYRLNFKKKIISEMAGFIDEDLIYTPDRSVPKEEFVKSAIFQRSCNSYHGEDHFKGKIDKTEIEFSEVVARHKTTTGTGSKTKENYSTIFKGIFIIADFNKHFNNHTLVLPDTAEKLFGKFGQNLQSMSTGRGELIRLEDPEFEKEFCVYGDDQVEARYILSASLMKRIVEFKRKWNKKVYLSFRDSKVCIAIGMNSNLFETRLFKSVVDYEFIEKNMGFMLLLTGVVEDLNLNTRLWTKN